MEFAKLTLQAGSEELTVQTFEIDQEISELFEVTVCATSHSPRIDMSAIVGKAAALSIQSGHKHALAAGRRAWSGICSEMSLSGSVVDGLSSYDVSIAPNLWLLTLRRNHRVFQHIAIPDIVDALLAEWTITPTWKVDRSRYPKLEYRVQYGETDYQFLCRLLEEASIAFTFPHDETSGSILTFNDSLATGKPRSRALKYVDNPNEASEREFATELSTSLDVRAGACALRDTDFRKPRLSLLCEATRKAAAPEDRYEHYAYRPGATLTETDVAERGDTPLADAQGVARRDARHGARLAQQALHAIRTERRIVSFASNAYDLRLGEILSLEGAPAQIGEDKLMVVEMIVSGERDEQWDAAVVAVFADDPF